MNVHTKVRYYLFLNNFVYKYVILIILIYHYKSSMCCFLIILIYHSEFLVFCFLTVLIYLFIYLQFYFSQPVLFNK